jgi:hypothetical protein
MGRIGETADVAEVVVWLSSDAASCVTGHTMTVDGESVAQTSVKRLTTYLYHRDCISSQSMVLDLFSDEIN